MAFQDSAGTIILNAVLTDIGRKRMMQGNFVVTNFGLGDDEVDYELGNSNNGTFELDTNPPIQEAYGGQNANIHFGLLDLPRNDVLYLPQLKVNSKIDNAVRTQSSKYHIAINTETSLKLKSDIGNRKYLQNNSDTTNMIVVESGIELPENITIVPARNKINQERYLLNLSLLDNYIFLYADGRLIKNLLVNNSLAYYRNDHKNNLYTNLQPLDRIVKSSIGTVEKMYDTYSCSAVINEVYNRPGSNGNDFSLSAFNGPRGSVMGFNLSLNDKIVNAPASDPDDRFRRFGTLNQTLFGGSNTYDYIDTNILAEGASSGKQLIIPIRIIRYRSA